MQLLFANQRSSEQEQRCCLWATRRHCAATHMRATPLHFLRPTQPPMQLYNLNSQYGNEQELRELNRKLREAGIR